MPQDTKQRIPTLIDWYLTDVAGEPIERETVLRTIKKHGRLVYPEYQFGIVGKQHLPGDDREDAPPYYARTLSVEHIECTGNGGFKIKVLTERCKEFLLHRDNMLSSEQLAAIKKK